jgi:hypothetical protein
MHVVLPILLPGPDGKSTVETIEVSDNCKQCGAQRYKVSIGTLRLGEVTYLIESVKAVCEHRQNWTELYKENETIKEGLDQAYKSTTGK